MLWNNQKWNENIGVCEKHRLPSLPCPACMAELEAGKDTGMYAQTNEWERFSGEYDVPAHFDRERHPVY